MRVLIIGAGLGGLCLAHGLRRAGHDVAVFERRSSAAAQPASYGIHLDANGLRALHACLPEENFAQLVAGATPARDVIRFRDRQLRPLAVVDRETPENASDPITRRRAVRRDVLRDALLLGLDGAVRWDAEFVGCTETAAGVEVALADGRTAHGDVLVGADGGSSRVRAQRLPGIERVDLGIVNIAGRVPLTSDLARRLPVDLVDGSINNVLPSGAGWIFVSTWQDELGATFVVWAWVGERASYPADVETMSPQALRDLVSARIVDWHPGLQEMVRVTDPTTVAPVVLRSMTPLPGWTPSAVTVLGDAIHSMTPMAGIGANTALRDADELRRALSVDGPAAEPVVVRIGRYEQRMRGYANEALALSARNARSAATEARLPRMAFRTVLRLAEHVPPVKRALFPAKAG